MDAVYILGRGSQASNEEIRHSVRSLDYHMLDLDRVFVVGEDPGFLPSAIHIPCDDTHAEGWKNTYRKVLAACADERVSDTFLLMNDDFFMLESFMGKEWPFYAIKGANGGTCGAHAFQIHAPMQIEKALFLKVPFSTDQKACRSWRSFYANFCHIAPTLIDDTIVFKGSPAGDYKAQTKGKAFFSIGDEVMQEQDFLSFLHDLYPDPSRFEMRNSPDLDKSRA